MMLTNNNNADQLCLKLHNDNKKCIILISGMPNLVNFDFVT